MSWTCLRLHGFKKKKKKKNNYSTGQDLYHFSQPTDLLLLKPLRNHLFRLSRKSTDKKKSITAHAEYPLDKRNGLKMSASATSVAGIHQSLSSLALCGPSCHRLHIFVYSVFQTEFLSLRCDVYCRSEPLIHPLPGETLTYRHNPFTFFFFFLLSGHQSPI